MTTAAQLIDAFARGLISPIVTPAHLIGLVGFALLMPLQALRIRVVSCTCLAIGMAAGLAAIAFAVGATPARNVVLSVSVVCGILAAVAADLPRIVVVALAAVAGVAIGLDSPPETVSLTLGHIMLAGTWLGACMALGILGAAATALHRAWPIALRVLGSWIAASALLGLTLRLVR